MNGCTLRVFHSNWLLVIDSFLYCKGTKKNNAKQEFSGFILNLFQMLKLRGTEERMSKNRQEFYSEMRGY